MTDELDYPTERSRTDIAHVATSAGLSIIPWVGGALQTVAMSVWVPALDRRREAWFRQLGKDVETLAGEVGDLEVKLSEDAVLDAAVRAAAIADATSSEDKRRMLRAAVLNTGLQVEPDDDIRAVFLRLVDDLTPSHVRMLRFIAGPGAYAQEAGISLDGNLMAGSLSTHVGRVFPKWDRGFYGRLIGDLDRAGLSQAGSALHTTMTGRGTLEPRITEFGQRFLAFVTHPLDGG